MTNPFMGEREIKMIETLEKEGWVRLPRPDQKFYGLCASKISQLCRDGKIKTVVITKEKNGFGIPQKKGIRMFYRPSFDEYLQQRAGIDFMADLEAMGALSVSKEDAKPPQAYNFNVGRWVRLPKEKETLCGLRRSSIFQLCTHGKVKSIKLVSPGREQQRRCLRLIFLPSLYAYLDRLANEQARALGNVSS